MAVINFDEKCRERDVEQYCEMIRRRTLKNMAISEFEHNEAMRLFRENAKKSNEKLENYIGIAFLIVIALGAGYLIYTF